MRIGSLDLGAMLLLLRSLFVEELVGMYPEAKVV